MEIFMHNLPPYIEDLEVKICIAQFLHGPIFDHVQTNFAVHLNRTKRGARTRTGTFTIADVAVGTKFLQFYGSSNITIGNNRVYFKISNKTPRQDIVESISRLPWINPVEEQQQKSREAKLNAKAAKLMSIQFGWFCRDDVFSIENEATQESQLRFDPQRRELHIIMIDDSFEYTTAIRQSSISSSSVHTAPGGRSILYLELSMPPIFLRRIRDAGPQQYIRLPSLPLFSNPRATPFTCLALRVVFSSSSDSDTFKELAEEARLRNIQNYQVVAERRDLFSVAQLDLVQRQLRRFNWCVAYQLAALLQNMTVDAAELLELMPRVRRLAAAKGKDYTAKLLKRFNIQASMLFYKDGDRDLSTCFNATELEFTKQDDALSLVPDDGSYYQSLHVTITPTSLFLNGPHPEQSNRVIRRYEVMHQESFLRVSFRDENDMQYRVDRDIDGAAFIKDRLGAFLKQGLKIADRKFEFLAYSQSALKDHSVWFVKPFNDSVHGLVTARNIIESLGSFDNLSYDPTLMRCPARYAARISQAFTATDAAVVPVEEILHIPDIYTVDGKYCFTDGVGTMSNDLAKAIWEKLRETRRKGKKADSPHAYQIRYQGSKGMLSIDYKLNGSHAIGLRPSMTKFDSPQAAAGDQHSIEIARAFDRPTTYFLNRPLIMLLEGLGVRYEVFKDFQDLAVDETKNATSTLKAAARLLETHGLGTSFRLSATMNNLDKLGLDSLPDDKFYTQFLKFAVHHILRDLKHHARIPIPNAWTLVGVADVHHYLADDQVFACVKQPNHGAFYIEGPVLISRSPTIHPGDVQMAYAIGIPPENSCFSRESIPNTIVFSVKGRRPLSTSLGGGDLDGDIYNIIPLNDHPWFQPTKPIFDPAEYPPTQRKLLDRPSTIDDVADFVMEYIISDVVGIIAINWLIIADQSIRGIEDEDCLRLAELHSDAVDYPKSGRPVDPEQIPRLKFRARPDWNAPETINPTDSGTHYQSQRIIGKLFRDIDLDELPMASRTRRRRGRVQQQRGVDALANELASFSLHGAGSIVFHLVESSVRKYFDTTGPWEKEDKDHVARLFRNYCTELTGTATNYSISHRNLLLAEEELIIGTITQKTSQPRVRKENMRKVREQTDILVRGVRQELEGDEHKTCEDYLKHCWLAWELSLVETRRNTFGAQSFGWLALGAIFDALKQVEDQDATEIRSTLNRRRR